MDEKRSRWLKIVPIIAGLITGTASIFLATSIGIINTSEDDNIKEQSRLRVDAALISLNKNQEQLTYLQGQLQTIMDAIEREPGSVPIESELGLRIDAISQKIEDIEKNQEIIDIIERAVIENPERAMSIPILRRDIDALADDIANAVTTGQAQIDRLYDMSKWFLGLIATIAVGLLGTGIAGLRRDKKQGE